MKHAFWLSILLLLLTTCEVPFGFISYSADEAAVIEAAVDSTSQTRMSTHISNLEGYRSPWRTDVDLSVYEDYITDYFEIGIGLTVTKEPVVNGGEVMNNIIAIKPGSDSSLAPVYVTAHWDTVYSSPGADDNASGCSGVMELAQCIDSISLARDVVYIIFSFEEDGTFGSEQHVGAMTRKPKAVFNLEMIGFISDKEVAPELFHAFIDFPRYGDFLGIFTDNGSRELGMNYIRAIDDFVPQLKYYLVAVDKNVENNDDLADIYRSDHAPFWRKGIPALFITDTADFRAGTPYHTENDTIEHINFNFMEMTVQSTIAAVLLYADIEP